MSGTPVANRPYDIWAQIYFLDKGKSLGNNFEEFKKLTDLSNKLSEDAYARECFIGTQVSSREAVMKVAGVFSSTFSSSEGTGNASTLPIDSRMQGYISTLALGRILPIVASAAQR